MVSTIIFKTTSESYWMLEWRLNAANIFKDRKIPFTVVFLRKISTYCWKQKYFRNHYQHPKCITTMKVSCDSCLAWSILGIWKCLTRKCTILDYHWVLKFENFPLHVGLETQIKKNKKNIIILAYVFSSQYLKKYNTITLWLENI